MEPLRNPGPALQRTRHPRIALRSIRATLAPWATLALRPGGGPGNDGVFWENSLWIARRKLRLASFALCCNLDGALSVTPIYETYRMSQLKVHVGDFTFDAKFEEKDAPKTVAAFKKAMPFVSQAIHVRWSGEGVWMPLGDLDFGVPYENHTSFPAPGHIILYPGGISETEILLAYSGVSFASKMGQLAGNHFITLTSNLDNLKEMGKTVLWKGAQAVRFEMV
jgi:hypothetical protein